MDKRIFVDNFVIFFADSYDMKNINVSLDVDGTLTEEVIGKDILELVTSNVEEAMLNCIPKNGRQEKYRGATSR